MKHTLKIILLTLLIVLLVAELGFVLHLSRKAQEPEVTTAPTAAPTQPPTNPPTEPPTEPPTDPPTEPPTEPPVSYTFSFAGDCTLGTYKDKWYSAQGFIKVIGENYDHPFQNVRQYFENDDFTIINLEVVLADKGYSVGKTFTFRGPTAYSQIMSGSSVEAVTLANNHTMDYGEDGYKSTKKVLTDAGIHYAENYSSTLITLDKGLVVGLYALGDDVGGIDQKRAVSDIKKLKEDGAELIIVAAHWGKEGQYRPTATQEKLGRAMIDAGANIIYGHHPHVLQPIEEYNGGIIYYSMGNFCFGGHTNPRDKDSVLIQQEVIRTHDGTVSLGELTLIPCSISSSDRNNYQPTPCEAGSEMYNRVLAKLKGVFDGSNLDVDYSNMSF